MTPTIKSDEAIRVIVEETAAMGKSQWMNADDLAQEFRMTSSGDFYGNVMGWWFAISAELDIRGEDVPAEWHYRPGAGGSQREPDCYEADVCQDASTEALITFGNKMSRAYAICKARGWDY